MKFFITGANGQLGHDILRQLSKTEHEFIGSDIHESCDLSCKYLKLDITDKDAVTSALENCKPDVIIHCAAWTAVDAAEEKENYDLVEAINVTGTKNLAEIADTLRCKFIYISTDYVFDGSGETPWTPDNKDYRPLNFYGKSKLSGELAVTEILEKYFIVRIAWVFGLNGNNFIKTMLNIGKKYDTLRVVSDQVGTPTYTYDLAALLISMAESENYGYYHATNEGGFISWYDFACEIFRQAGYSTTVIPVTTEEYGLSKALRPKNSRLCKQKLVENNFKPLPSWQDALHRFLEELNNN